MKTKKPISKAQVERDIRDAARLEPEEPHTVHAPGFKLGSSGITAQPIGHSLGHGCYIR